jgi:hypothetical protein
VAASHERADLRGWIAATVVILAVFLVGAVLWFTYHR